MAAVNILCCGAASLSAGLQFSCRPFCCPPPSAVLPLFPDLLLLLFLQRSASRS